MTDIDYLVEVPIETYEDLFPEEDLNQIVEGQINEYKSIRKNQSIFESDIQNLDEQGQSMHLCSEIMQGGVDNKNNNYDDQRQTPVQIIEYTSNKITPLRFGIQKSQFSSDEDNKYSMFSQQNQNQTLIQMKKESQHLKSSLINSNGEPLENKNIRTLIEKMPIFEEELEDNIKGTKTDNNLMRSEVFTMMADQNTNVLQYRALIEERQQIRERNQNTISQMNNNTLLNGVEQNQSQLSPEESNQQGISGQQTAFEGNDTYTDALKMVNFYKRICNYLEQSLEEKLNGLRAIHKLYIKYFIKIYSNILMEHQKSGKMQIEQSIVDEMIKDIQQFIHFFLYCVIFFYELDNLLPQKKHSQLVNKENLWNLLINIFFSNNEIYTLCFELIQISLIEQERSLQQKMIDLDKVLPHHLEIHPKFCLNNKTIEWKQKQKLHNQQKSISPVLSEIIQQNQNQYLQIPKQNVSHNQIHKNTQEINDKCTVTPQFILPDFIQQDNSQTNNINDCFNKKQYDELETLEEESEFLFAEGMLSHKSSNMSISRRIESQNNEESTKIQKNDEIIQKSKYQNNQDENADDSIIKLYFGSSQVTKQSERDERKSIQVQNSQELKQSTFSNTQKQIDLSPHEKENEEQCKDQDQQKNKIENQKYNEQFLKILKDSVIEDINNPSIPLCEINNNQIATTIPISHSQYIPTIKIKSPKSQDTSPIQNLKKQTQYPKSNFHPEKQQQLQLQQQQQSLNKSIMITNEQDNQKMNTFIQQNHRNQNNKYPQSCFEQNCPYFKAVKKLKNLNFYNSPVHKMKLLVDCFELIPACVQEFYEQTLGLSEQNLIASDDLVNILVFIVLKSKCTQLNSHLKLISSFLSKSNQSNKIGYYCTTLLMVASYLESDKIYENIESLRSKSELFNQTIIQMNSSYLRKSSFNQNIEITSMNNLTKILSNQNLEIGIQTTNKSTLIQPQQNQNN